MEVQVVGISGTTNRTGPVVAAVTEIVNRSTVHDAGPHKVERGCHQSCASIGFSTIVVEVKVSEVVISRVVANIVSNLW